MGRALASEYFVALRIMRTTLATVRHAPLVVGLLAQAFLTPLFLKISVRHLFSLFLEEDAGCDASRCANQVEGRRPGGIYGLVLGTFSGNPNHI